MRFRWNVLGPTHGHHWKLLTSFIFLFSLWFGHSTSAASPKSVVSQHELPRPADFKMTIRTPPIEGQDVPFAGETSTWEAFIKKNDVRDTAKFSHFVSSYMSPPSIKPESQSIFYTAELQALKLEFLHIYHPYVFGRKTWKLPLILMVEDETKENGRPQRTLKNFLQNLFGTQEESRANFLQWLHSGSSGKEIDLNRFYDVQRLYEQYVEWYYHLPQENQHILSQRTDHMEHYDLVYVKKIEKKIFLEYLMHQEYYPLSYISRENLEPKLTIPLFKKTWTKYMGISQYKFDEFILWLRNEHEEFSTIDESDFYKKKDLVYNYVKWVHDNFQGWYIPAKTLRYGLRYTVEELNQGYKPRDLTFDIISKSMIKDPVERMYFKSFVKKLNSEGKGISQYTEDSEISKEDIHRLHIEWSNAKKSYLYRFYNMIKQALFRMFSKGSS